LPWRGVCVGALVLVAGWTFSAYGPHWIDDSYITFRFAQKLAEGKGLAYNAGERTLGFSAPLYTLILGATTALGLPILPTSLALGMLGVAGALALLVALGRVAGNELAGWAAAFLTITQFFWVIFFVSGMETMLVCAVTLGLLGAASAGRWKLIGPLAGILCWLRYDGALGAAVALGWMAWRAGRRTAGREVLKAAAVYLPWFLFSWAYFGSPIPQTIRAKSLINYTGDLAGGCRAGMDRHRATHAGIRRHPAVVGHLCRRFRLYARSCILLSLVSGPADSGGISGGGAGME
jgi:hypothetical protein